MKCRREMEIRASLPKTPVGKLSKKELVAEELAKRQAPRRYRPQLASDDLLGRSCWIASGIGQRRRPRIVGVNPVRIGWAAATYWSAS